MSAEKTAHYFLFPLCIRTAAERYLKFCRAAHYAAVMRECLVAFSAVVLPHAGSAHAAESEMRACNMKYCIVDTAAAE